MCHSQKVTVTLYSIFSRAVGYIHPVAQTGICCKRVCWKFQCNVTMVKLQLFVRPPSRHAPVNKHLLHCGKVAGSQPLACLCEHRENEENTLEQSSISNKKKLLTYTTHQQCICIPCFDCIRLYKRETSFTGIDRMCIRIDTNSAQCNSTWVMNEP